MGEQNHLRQVVLRKSETSATIFENPWKIDKFQMANTIPSSIEGDDGKGELWINQLNFNFHKELLSSL